MTPGRRDPRTSGFGALSWPWAFWTVYMLSSAAILFVLRRGRLDVADCGYLAGAALAWWAGYLASAIAR